MVGEKLIYFAKKISKIHLPKNLSFSVNEFTRNLTHLGFREKFLNPITFKAF